ncbi:unnamed protein product [Choristocarpus tenellus]
MNGLKKSHLTICDEWVFEHNYRYLWDVTIPALNSDLKRGSLCPSDCVSLSTSLHNLGINMRYLGRLAQIAVEEEREDASVQAEGKARLWRMPTFWLEMLEVEMVARAVSYVFSRFMAAGQPRSYSAPGFPITLFLNALLGMPVESQPSSPPDASAGTAPEEEVSMFFVSVLEVVGMKR